MASILTACSGFLLAVLWMDLIFDSQALRRGGNAGALDDAVLASIAGYYHRATTTSQPMSRLIAVVMLIFLGALGFRVFRGQDPMWLSGASVVLTVVPVTLALTRTVPRAVRLGLRGDDVLEQSRLARSILRDHLVCAACMSCFLALWLARALAS